MFRADTLFLFNAVLRQTELGCRTIWAPRVQCVHS